MTIPWETQDGQAVPWRNCVRVRQKQRVAGRASGLLLLLAVLLLLDGLLAVMRTDSGQVDLLPGQTVVLSGPVAVKTPRPGDVQVRFVPETASLQFVLEGFFTGHWFGNGMWRGEVRALKQSLGPEEAGRYELQLSFRGAVTQAPQKYVVLLWESEAAQRAASPSWVYRLTGWNSFVLAADLGGLGLLCGLITYGLGRRAFHCLTALGCSEVFRVSPTAPRHIWCLAAGLRGPHPGDSLPLLDAAGKPLGEVQVELLHKNVLELVVQNGAMQDDSLVQPGCLVCGRSVADSSGQGT